MTTKRTNHSVYNLNYHLVFVTKYRNRVLVGNIETSVKERVAQLGIEYGFELTVLSFWKSNGWKTTSIFSFPRRLLFRLCESLKP